MKESVVSKVRHYFRRRQNPLSRINILDEVNNVVKECQDKTREVEFIDLPFSQEGEETTRSCEVYLRTYASTGVRRRENVRLLEVLPLLKRRLIEKLIIDREADVDTKYDIFKKTRVLCYKSGILTFELIAGENQNLGVFYEKDFFSEKNPHALIGSFFCRFRLFQEDFDFSIHQVNYLNSKFSHISGRKKDKKAIEAFMLFEDFANAYLNRDLSVHP